MACKLSFIVKSEGVLKVTGSHVHFRSGSISKTVLDRDIVTTGVYTAYLKSAIAMTLDVSEGHPFVTVFFKWMFRSCKISTDKRVSRSLCS